MTNFQAREATRISTDRAERYAEMDWRAQLLVDRKAREMRAENARRVAAALRH